MEAGDTITQASADPGSELRKRSPSTRELAAETGLEPTVTGTQYAIHKDTSAAASDARRMVPAELSGAHTHPTEGGVKVHIWRRGDTLIARGRYRGQRFGITLGESREGAIAKLRQILVDLDNDSFVRPSEARNMPLSDGRIPRLSLRQLINEFLSEKRKTRGQGLADTYRSRLAPVLDFAETPGTRLRWPLAVNIDRQFVIDARVFLQQYQTTSNGRAGGVPKPMKPRQVINVLECLRTALRWACRADVRKLPAAWVSPMTQELIGTPPPKDPLRHDPLPQDLRVQLVGLMDAWQLSHLATSLLLPLRPDEVAGLLIDDVDFARNLLVFRTRFDGADFTKGKTSFQVPFPQQLIPILKHCIGGRAAGPLLRSRKAYGNRGRTVGVVTPEELAELISSRLRMAQSGGVMTDNDRKRAFRKLLRDLGGVSKDRLAAEFVSLLEKTGVTRKITFYALRGAVTTAMSRTGMPHLELRYLTSHTTSDILNEYVALDPVAAMTKYFATITPLLDAIMHRAEILGLTTGV